MAGQDGNRKLANLFGVSEVTVGPLRPVVPGTGIVVCCPKCGAEIAAACPAAPGEYTLTITCKCGMATEHLRTVEAEGASAIDYQARHSEMVIQQE